MKTDQITDHAVRNNSVQEKKKTCSTLLSTAKFCVFIDQWHHLCWVYTSQTLPAHDTVRLCCLDFIIKQGQYLLIDCKTNIYCNKTVETSEYLELHISIKQHYRLGKQLGYDLDLQNNSCLTD